MPTLKGQLSPDGAMVSVLVGLSVGMVQNLRKSGRLIPPTIPAQAILDTGSEVTCVDTTLVQSLNLPFCGTSIANIPALGGLSINALHDAGLTILHPSGNPRFNLLVRNLSVLDMSLQTLGYQVLIGRDLLAICRFFFDGRNDRFFLGY